RIKTMPIHQELIIDKLNKYSSSIGGEDGLCHGFSYVHAAMAAIDKLDWWQDSLRVISEWDENLDSLDKKVNIKGQDESITLGQIFERITSYILFNFNPGLFLKGANGKPLGQEKIVDVFEVIDPISGKFLTINKDNHKIVAGELNNKDLKYLLNFKNLKNNMCILSSNDHTCSLRCDNNQYYFYDPNFTEGEKRFNSIKELIPELRECLSRTFLITLIDIKKENNLGLEAFSKFKLKLRHLKKSGFQQLVQKAPNLASQALSLATTARQRSILISILCYCHIENHLNGLESLAIYAPHLVNQALNLAITNKDKLKLASALCHAENEEKWNGLQILAIYAPQLINQALDLATTNKAKSKLISALCHVDNHGHTGLQILAMKSPNSVSKAIALAINKKDRLRLISALYQVDKKGMNGFEALINYAPNSIQSVLDLAVTDKEKTRLVSLLCQVDSQGQIGLQKLSTHAPASVSQALALAVTNEDRSKLILSICKVDEQGQSEFEKLVRNAPDSVPYILTLAGTNEERKKLVSLITDFDKSKIIKDLCEPDHNGWTKLQILTYTTPNLVYAALDLAVTNQDKLKLISALLNVDPKGFNLLQVLSHTSENSLKILSQESKFYFIHPILNRFEELQVSYYPALESLEKHYLKNKSSNCLKWDVMKEFIQVAKVCAINYMKGFPDSFQLLEHYRDEIAVFAQHKNNLCLRVSGSFALSILGAPLIWGLGKAIVRASQGKPFEFLFLGATASQNKTESLLKGIHNIAPDSS
ncbi:hypothetical protein, partial [Piscirickettsia salmonis]|uniref:hypothetical protein n=2 Tax=Piscirickettsia salmonis TaxID=1238 RepID=UPI003EBB1E26